MPTTVSIADIRSLSDVLPDETMKVYVAKGDGCVLYVGKSKDAIERMLSHLGLGNWSIFWGSDFDQALSRLYPHSDSYTVEFISASEVASLYGMPPAPKEGEKRVWWEIEVDAFACTLEEELIYHLSPVFNVIGQKKTRANSERWYALYPPGIANKGIVL